MKKLIILFLISCLIIIFIYNKNYKKYINVLSINSLEKEDDFNPYLTSLFSKSSINYKFITDYTNKTIEIENLIAKIRDIDKLKNVIHQSNVIIISLGNIDKKTEDINTIIKEMKDLFKLLREINNQEIIYISPPSIKNTILFKEQCVKYKIKYINGSSFIHKPNLIAQLLYNDIEKSWNKEKY